MKYLKKSLAALSLFTILFTAMPKEEAQAGIIFSEIGIGIYLIIIGALENDTGLIILDENSSSNKINVELQNRYGNLTSNQQVFKNLTTMIAAKSQDLDFSKESKIEVKFTKNEIVMALGSAAANSELLEAVTNDLM